MRRARICQRIGLILSMGVGGRRLLCSQVPVERRVQLSSSVVDLGTFPFEGMDFEFKVLSRHQAGPQMWTGCTESGAKVAVIFYQSFDFYFNKEIIVSLAEVFCVSSF